LSGCHRVSGTGNGKMVHQYALVTILAKLVITMAGQCGVGNIQPNITTGPVEPKIVGGSPAKANSYPWMVSVQSTTGHICGGALIRASETKEASDIVVTAAHCLYAKPANVLLGAHSLKTSSPGRQLVRISKTVYHPSYNSQTQANDIAVFKLEKPISFSQIIQAVCLPESGEQRKEGDRGVVTGWGATDENGQKYPDILQQAVLPVYNTQKCAAAYQSDKVPINAKIQFCAGYPQGKIDTCVQDSGGPWILKNNKGQFVLQGIVSFGKEKCGLANSPGVYTLVSTHAQWVKDQVKVLTSVK